MSNSRKSGNGRSSSSPSRQSNNREKAGEKIGRKIEEYMNDKDTPQNSIDAFWSASQKMHVQGYRQNTMKIQTAIPLLASGHALPNKSPYISFKIEDANELIGCGCNKAVEMIKKTPAQKQAEEEQNELQKPVVEIEGDAVRTDNMDVQGEEKEEEEVELTPTTTVGSQITLSRDAEDSSSFYIRAPNRNGLVIPSKGVWNLSVSGLMPLGQKGEEEEVIGEESGFYDIDQTIKNNPDAVSRDGRCITLIHDITAPINEEDYSKNGFPTSQLHISVTKGIDQKYYLNGARIACSYGNCRRVPAVTCDPCRHDNRIYGRSAVAPVLLPQRYGYNRPTSSYPDEEYTGYNYSYNTPSTHDGEDEFRQSFGTWINEELQKLPEDQREGISVRVSLANRNEPLYDRTPNYQDTKRPLMYSFGTATRPLTAITLVRLLQSQPEFDWQTQKDDARYVSQVLLKDHCIGKALRKLYRRSCNLPGPTILQLLTETSGLPTNLSIHPSQMLDYVNKGLEKMEFKADENELASLLQNQELVFYPGSQVHESNVAWAIIGAIIRKLANVDDSTIAIIQTARALNMPNSDFVSPSTPSQEFGPSQRVLAPNSGMYGSVSDLDALLRSLHSPAANIEGMKVTIIPTYRRGQGSTVAVTPGGWNVARVLSCKGEDPCSQPAEQRVCKYTTLGVDGWCGHGDGVYATTIPDYSLNISFGCKRFTAPQCSEFANNLVSRCVHFYKQCCFKKARHPPCVPANRVDYCPLPPYYHSAHNCQRVERRRLGCAKRIVRSSCHSRMSLSFYLNTGCAKRYGGYDRCKQVCRQACDSQTEFAPLIGQRKIADYMRVFSYNKPGEEEPIYMLKFYSSDANMKRIPPEIKQSYLREDNPTGDPQALTLRIVPDPTTGTFRVMDGDVPSEHVHFYTTKSELGNDITAVQVYGITYTNAPYVAALVSQLVNKHKQIRETIESDKFRSIGNVTAKSVESIGASYVLPAVLTGLAAAGAGVVAGTALSAAARGAYYDPYYSDYYNYYDPYTYSSYYYNPYYVSPLWGYGYGRTYPWWYSSPYYGWRGRPRVATRPYYPWRRPRYVRPRYRVASSPTRYGGTAWRSGGIRTGRSGPGRRGGRRSAIGQDMENHQKLHQIENQSQEASLNATLQKMAIEK